ncbi:MAG TPA: phosphoserine aminotransferase [Microscillaceae bacterium]|nr:phosphoserine aminotransferase [Microscillaceae bacterium]
MITFYPGPSKVYPQVAQYVQEAVASGIISQNHRSPAFVDLSKNTITTFKEKLGVPADYWVFYASSATECWEIIAQSLIQTQSFHIYNGAFGQKWAAYTHKLGIEVQAQVFEVNELLAIEKLNIPSKAELIAITHNETSNGTALTNAQIAQLRQQYPEQLIAVDATSSLGGVYLDFSQADIWYASVQKCLGLPSGMALMVCSPRAMERAKILNACNHYNSLAFMIEKMEDWQTTYTPNILNIYLLNRVMQQISSIKTIDEIIQKRFTNYLHFLQAETNLTLLCEVPEARSATVLAIKGSLNRIAHIKAEAQKQNIILGNGYGAWKETTFRVANFPAITDNEMVLLQDFLKSII